MKDFIKGILIGLVLVLTMRESADLMLLTEAAEPPPVQQPERMIPRPAVDAHEPVWSAYLADRVGGVAEYRCHDGTRVDILTDRVAWEVEWCQKWPESIGQAIHYAAETNRTPGVWILKRPGDDEDYLRFRRAVLWAESNGLKIEINVENVK